MDKEDPEQRVADLEHQLAKWQQPPPPPPLRGPQQPWAMPTPQQRGWRPGVVIPAVVAVALLIGGGVFAAVRFAQLYKHNPTSAAPKSSATTPPTTEGSFPQGTPLPPFRAHRPVWVPTASIS